jgi:uncharacterized protein YbjT (DUF2867 family)
MKILITGATGNIGTQVIRYLSAMNEEHTIVAGLRKEKDAALLSDYPKLEICIFDFENANTFDKCLIGIDILFLLRPPQISDIDKYFRPLISKIKEIGGIRIVFLSVQGAELSSIIPHNKIEKLIRDYAIDYVFLRPAYFIQNLTTTLLNGIKESDEIQLPAGKAKFNWVDTHNIGEVAACVINDFDKHKNTAIEITGNELLNFKEVTKQLSNSLGREIKYRNRNPISFYFAKRREGVPSGFAIVMIVLHFLPRFQEEPKITNVYYEVTGKKPTLLKEFIKREKHLFE